MEELTAKKDGSYHFHFGPCIAHDGVVYAVNNHNTSLGLLRLTRCRVPLLKGFESFLREQQRLFIRKQCAFTTHLRELYSQSFINYEGCINELLTHHDDPHQKRALRVQAYEWMLQENKLYDHSWSKFGTRIKMKSFEIAKPGKIPRNIADLGVPASLRGFRVTAFYKKAMALNPIEILGGSIVYCPKPNPFQLEEIFRHLIEPPDRFYFVLFSDDSCLSIRTSNGILRYNIDISSCDGSHTEDLFSLLVELVPDCAREDMEALVNQCRRPFTVYDCNNHSRSVTLRPKQAKLYSGSTLTTIINNLANILIAYSIAESDIESSQDVILAARRAGYIVTCEDCSDWHNLQFLKHSPVFDDKKQIRPLLNIGVLLRLTGTSRGDIPGSNKVPLEVRCNKFQESLLRGAYPKAHFTLIDNMRSRLHVDGSEMDRYSKSLLAYKVEEEEEYPDFYVPSHEVWQRYDLDTLEIHELEEVFGNAGYGDHFISTGAVKVLNLDYGLGGNIL